MVKTISQECINLVAKWEGFHTKAYLCPAKVWTIGYGTTKYENGKSVKAGDTITKERAMQLLKLQVQQHADTIPLYVKRELSQNQFDSLASFQYNLGRHILSHNKTLLNALNNGEWVKATQQMMLYNKARVNGKLIELKGLTNRRKDEVALFLKSAPAKVSVPATKKYSSLVDYLKANGQASDFNARQKLAIKYGIKNYSGSAEQNTKLLAILQK